MSPAKLLLALAVIALAGVAAYAVSTVMPRSAVPEMATQPAAPPPRPAPAPAPPPQAANFHAIVERDGAVVLCISNGGILFPDRCAGSGRLSVVQPIAEGEVTLVTATGVVTMENESPQNPDCALSKAKWDPATEKRTPTGRKIRQIPAAAVAQQLNKVYAGHVSFEPEDISAFGVDLDSDGKEDIIYVADNVSRLAKLNEKTQQSYRYLMHGGIFKGRSPGYPSTFFRETGEYQGATDAIGHVTLKGIVPIAESTGELALLARAGWGVDGDQRIVRVSTTGVQSIETFEFRCN
jgi:hypothetical protein